MDRYAIVEERQTRDVENVVTLRSSGFKSRRWYLVGNLYKSRTKHLLKEMNVLRRGNQILLSNAHVAKLAYATVSEAVAFGHRGSTPLVSTNWDGDPGA